MENDGQHHGRHIHAMHPAGALPTTGHHHGYAPPSNGYDWIAYQNAPGVAAGLKGGGPAGAPMGLEGEALAGNGRTHAPVALREYFPEPQGGHPVRLVLEDPLMAAFQATGPFPDMYPEHDIFNDSNLYHLEPPQPAIPHGRSGMASVTPGPLLNHVSQPGRVVSAADASPSTSIEPEGEKSHTRQASQDINPTPSKRAREGEENASPMPRDVAAPSAASTAAVSSKQKQKRARRVKSKPQAEPEEGTAEVTKTNWSDAETTKFLEAIFGTNPITKFIKFEKNPDRYCKKIAKKIFKGTRTARAVKNKYTRMRATFTNILTFESWTGGDSDPDLVAPPDWKSLTMEEVEIRFEKGRRAGKEYGELTTAVYKKWQKKGWYDYFISRLRAHPNLVREREHNAEVLSEREDHGGAEADADADPSSDSGSESSDDEEPAVGTAGINGKGDEETDSSSQSESEQEVEVDDHATATNTPSKIPSKVPLKTPSKKPESKTASRTPSNTLSRTSSRGTTPLSKQPGVPERKHSGKQSSLAAQAGEFMETNGKFLEGMQAASTGQLELARQQFEAGQARHTRQLEFEERQLDLQQKRFDADLSLQQKKFEAEERRAEEAKIEARVQEARRIIADPASPPALKDAASQVVLKYLMANV